MNLKEIASNIIIFCFLIGIIFLIGFVIVERMGIDYEKYSQVTYEKCCGGTPCSDTYYNEETGECIIGSPDTNVIPLIFSWVGLGIVFGTAFVLTIIVIIIGNKYEIHNKI